MKSLTYPRMNRHATYPSSLILNPSSFWHGDDVRVLLVIAGGAIGSAGRYLLSVWMVERFGASFPWGTLTVNVVGSFLIGLLATVADEAGRIGSHARLFLIVGVLGGFTTFSSLSLETWRLVEEDLPLRAMAYVVVAIALGLGAAGLGILTGRELVSW